MANRGAAVINASPCGSAFRCARLSRASPFSGAYKIGRLRSGMDTSPARFLCLVALTLACPLAGPHLGNNRAIETVPMPG